MLIYYKIYNSFLDHNFNSQYSPNDLIEMLKQVKMIKINNSWVISEISSKLYKLLKKLNL